jgi:glutamate-1-semialdehyde aminotransferase
LINKHEGDIAAVIMEPISAVEINRDSLLKIRAETKKRGIVLVFDETVSGFRVAPGGAQEILGITPDLTVFGKGIANGFPLSAIAGSSKVMSHMEKVFYSGTFGGELLSLAAAKVVLNKIKTQDVTKKLEIIGSNLAQKVNQVIEELAFEGLRISGHPSWNFLLWDSSKFKDVTYTKTLFLQEMFSRGILIITSHNVTLKHDKSALDKITKAYKEVLALIQKVEKENSYSDNLYVEPIEPLFKIRS